MDSKNNYLRNSQHLTEENKNSPVDLRRKMLVFNSAASKDLCKNDTTCLLLENNLEKYSQQLSDKLNDLNNEVKKKLPTNTPLFEPKTNLDEIDLRKLVKNLSCSNDVTCKSTENVSEHDFQTFRGLFLQKPTKTPLVEPDRNMRKIAKSFAPNCYITERNAIKKKGSADYGERATDFKTAKEELQQQNLQKYGSRAAVLQTSGLGQKRKLGTRRGGNQSKFVSPLLSNNDMECNTKDDQFPSENLDERLRYIDPKMVELIRSEIMDTVSTVTWSDIAGLDFAKTAIQEAIVWPMLRPDIFTGLRRPPKGILLFGPPGTGKTLIGKCVAAQSKSTFFSISASSLTSKWIGDGEKMVRALFAVARCHQPSVVFIDEVDSLLSQRSDAEHESSRRIKTEFLVQLDGATTDNEERLLIIGATNRPQELDEAARRRFVKRLYIPLPELEARFQLVQKLMQSEKHDLTEENVGEIAKLSDGYSGADMRNLCSEASLGPIRSLDIRLIERIDAEQVRSVVMEDFIKAFNRVKSSVAPKDLEQYLVWDNTYGSGCEM